MFVSVYCRYPKQFNWMPASPVTGTPSKFDWMPARCRYSKQFQLDAGTLPVL